MHIEPETSSLRFIYPTTEQAVPFVELRLPSSKLNPFPNKPWILRVCSTSLLKTLWEKKKLLVTSNFSFSHSVFYQFE